MRITRLTPLETARPHEHARSSAPIAFSRKLVSRVKTHLSASCAIWIDHRPFRPHDGSTDAVPPYGGRPARSRSYAPASTATSAAEAAATAISTSNLAGTAVEEIAVAGIEEWVICFSGKQRFPEARARQIGKAMGVYITALTIALKTMTVIVCFR